MHSIRQQRSRDFVGDAGRDVKAAHGGRISRLYGYRSENVARLVRGDCVSPQEQPPLLPDALRSRGLKARCLESPRVRVTRFNVTDVERSGGGILLQVKPSHSLAPAPRRSPCKACQQLLHDGDANCVFDPLVNRPGVPSSPDGIPRRVRYGKLHPEDRRIVFPPESDLKLAGLRDTDLNRNSTPAPGCSSFSFARVSTSLASIDSATALYPILMVQRTRETHAATLR